MNRGVDYQQQQHQGDGKIINIRVTVQMEAFQEGKYMQQIHFFHYQEDPQLQHLEMKIAM